MKKIILQTQKVFNGRYAFTLEVNFDSVEQDEAIIYYVKTDKYSVYKDNAYWYIVDKITNIEYSEHQLVNKTQLKELTELINKINKELNSDRIKWQTYYYIDYDLTVRTNTELLSNIDSINYELGNYFTDEEKAKETAFKLKEFWNNIKEENNTYIFRLSSNIRQINNILYKVRQQEVLNRILKICEIADRRLIQFTLEKGNIDKETGVMIKFNQNLEIKNIKDIKYVEVGNDYIYAWVSTQNKYIFLNM